MKTFILSLLLIVLTIPLLASEWIVSPNRAIRFNMLAFSPDGKLVAISDGQQLQLWDSDFKRMYRYFSYTYTYEERPIALFFSSDSKQIIFIEEIIESSTITFIKTFDCATGEVESIRNYFGLCKRHDGDILYREQRSGTDNHLRSLSGVSTGRILNIGDNVNWGLLSPDIDRVLISRPEGLKILSTVNGDTLALLEDLPYIPMHIYPYYKHRSTFIPLVSCKKWSELYWWDTIHNSIFRNKIDFDQSRPMRHPRFTIINNDKLAKSGPRYIRIYRIADGELLKDYTTPWDETDQIKFIDAENTIVARPAYNHYRKTRDSVMAFMVIDLENDTVLEYPKPASPIKGIYNAKSCGEILLQDVHDRMYRYSFSSQTAESMPFSETYSWSRPNWLSPYCTYFTYNRSNRTYIADFSTQSVLDTSFELGRIVFNREEDTFVSMYEKTKAMGFRIVENTESSEFRLQKMKEFDIEYDPHCKHNVTKNYLVAEKGDHVRLYDLENGLSVRYDHERLYDPKTSDPYHAIKKYAISPDERWLATANRDNTVLHDLENPWNSSITYPVRTSFVAFSDNGKQLITYTPNERGSRKACFKWWDIASRSIVDSVEFMKPSNIEGQDAPYRILRGGKYLLTHEMDSVHEEYNIYDIKESKLVCALYAEASTAISFQDDIAIGHTKIFRKPDFCVVDTLHYNDILSYNFRLPPAYIGHGGSPVHPHFNRDGSRIVTEGLSGEFFLFDSTSGEHLASLIYVKNGTQWLAYTPDGHYDGTADPTIYLSMVNGLDTKPFDTKGGTMRIPGLWKTLMEGK